MDRLNIKSNEHQISYDSFSDVLYISFGDPSPGLADEGSDGNFIRIDPYTDEIVGITILGFKKRYKLKPENNINEFAKSLIPEILKAYLQ